MQPWEFAIVKLNQSLYAHAEEMHASFPMNLPRVIIHTFCPLQK